MSSLPISLSAKEPDVQLKALQQSRLATLIQDKGLLSRIYEAAVNLLTDDKLRACDESSIMGALYKAASLGFRLERDFGECFLIPRNIKTKDVNGKDVWSSVCCFQVGYKGWKAICLQTGNVAFLESREVYAEDEFLFEYGTNAFLKHRVAEKNSGESTYFYARAKLANGMELFEVITKQAAETNRRFSESQYDVHGSYPNQTKVFSEKPKKIWAEHYAAMALRIPIKKLCAALPLTPAIERAMQEDGGITYLQKDGTVTTISPAETEATAEQPQKEVQPIDVDTLKDRIAQCLTGQALLLLYESNPAYATDYAELFTAQKAEIIRLQEAGQIPKQ